MAWETSRRFQSGALREVLLVGGPFLLGAALLACLRSPISFRVTLSMALLTLLVASYAAEAYLIALPGLRVRFAARRLGIAYDARDQFEVVRDLRLRGAEAYPAVFPAWQGLGSKQAGVLPLGGISGVTTVFCNELGQHVVYESDEHGFRNPPGTWSAPVIDLAVLGDSFAQGACVPSEESFVDVVRGGYPGTLNLGMLGNGPLLMLAGVKEFLVKLEPEVVLWVYTEGNDLVSDLEREKRYPRLVDYLAPGHEQGLLERQGEVDAFLRSLIDREYAARLAGGTRLRIPRRFWRLWTLRDALGLQVGKEESSAGGDIRLLTDILGEARRTVRIWGGELYFVYLPAEGRYHDDRYRRQADRTRAKVLSVVAGLQLPLVDLHARFSRRSDPAELYVFPGGHFTPMGNRVVAEAILEALPQPSGPVRPRIEP